MTERAHLTPGEVGRRAAADLDATMRRMKAGQDHVLNWLTNTHAARRQVQATGGTEQDAMRMVYGAGDKPLEAPRPRLFEHEG